MKNTEKQKSINFIGYIIFLVIIVVSLLGSYYVVSPGHRGVLITLGKVEQQSYLNGIGFKLPVISKMIQINVQTNTITEKASSYTLDVQTADIDYTITYKSSVSVEDTPTYAEYYIVSNDELEVDGKTKEWPINGIKFGDISSLDESLFTCDNNDSSCVVGVKAYSDAIQTAGFQTAAGAFAGVGETY